MTLMHHPRRFSSITTILAGMLFWVVPAQAIHPNPDAELDNLKKRIEILESGRPAPAAGAGSVLEKLGNYLTLHGVLEVEAGLVMPDAGDVESDLTLATAELSLEAAAKKVVGGHLTLLYEEDEAGDDSLTVDEAVISLTAPGSPYGQSLSLHAGRMYLPFGSYRSSMLSDPLTLELGETRDTALLLALSGELWVFQAGLFNGATDALGADNQLDNLVVSMELTPLPLLTFGVSYLNDLAESDNGLVKDAALYADNVPGASAFLSVGCSRFALELEYLAALEEFDSALLAVGEDLTGRRPAAWNLELSWLPRERLQLVARYEQAEDFRHDLVRYGGAISCGLSEPLVVGLEYLRAESDSDGESGNLMTAQLAWEF